MKIWLQRSPEFEHEAQAQRTIASWGNSLQASFPDLPVHLLFNVFLCGHEIDCILLTPRLFATIELKQVPRGAYVTATPNRWDKHLADGTTKAFEGVPAEQALRQGHILFQCAKEHFRLLHVSVPKTTSFVAISPQLPPSLQDDFSGALHSHDRLDICRLGTLEPLLQERIRQNQASMKLTDALLEAFIGEKIGLTEASLWDGSPFSVKSEAPVKSPAGPDQSELERLRGQIGLLSGQLDDATRKLAQSSRESEWAQALFRQEQAQETQSKKEISQLKEQIAGYERQERQDEAEVRRLHELLEASQRQIEELAAQAPVPEDGQEEDSPPPPPLRKRPDLAFAHPPSSFSLNGTRPRCQAILSAEAVSDAIYGRKGEEELWCWMEAFSSFYLLTSESFPAIDESKRLCDCQKVVCNLLSRGAPTRLSPYLERILSKALGLTTEASSKDVIAFRDIDPGYDWCSLFKNFSKAAFAPSQFENWDECYNRLELAFGPVLISRVEKVMAETLLTGMLPEGHRPLRILAIEHDITGVAWALEDLRQILENLGTLSGKDALRLPPFTVDVLPASNRWRGGDFYEDSDVMILDSLSDASDYDIVFEASVFQPETKVSIRPETRPIFTDFLLFSSNQPARPALHFGGNITYRPVSRKTQDGEHVAIDEPEKALCYFLQYIFRKQQFRPGQLPILTRALGSKSVIGLLPTGGGKSLTYQLASMLQPGVSLIVDPLKSLMQDQANGLDDIGIDSGIFLNSSLTEEEKEQKLKQLIGGECKFLFISPERMAIPSFRSTLQALAGLRIWFCYGVIDEVHCVSEWGHDFRTSYLHIGRNLYRYIPVKAPSDGTMRQVPLFGLTATASFDVLADVERELSSGETYQLDSDAIVRYEHTNRLELQYEVIHTGLKADHMTSARFLGYQIQRLKELLRPENVERIKKAFLERENIEEDHPLYRRIQESHPEEIDINDLLTLYRGPAKDKKTFGQAVLYFAPHVNGSLGVYSIYQKLEETLRRDPGQPEMIGFFSGSRPKYLSDVTDDEFEKAKIAVQNAYKKNELALMVATKAFGMGIDKPNIRLLAELNFPSSLEAFIQEAGRAGRDGKMALCTILYAGPNSSDREVPEFFHKQAFPGLDTELAVTYYLLFEESFSVEGPTQYHLSDLLKGDSCSRATLYVGRYPTSYTRTRNGRKGTTVTINESAIKKALYRLTLLGAVTDIQQDYGNEEFILSVRPQSEGDIYDHVRSFLERYYSAKKAADLVQEWREQQGKYYCLEYCVWKITQFIYAKIGQKRERAIDHMLQFCDAGIEDAENTSWLERNENLKDWIYYYFNSKYARTGYTTDSGEPFSLYDDTEGAKVSSPEIVWKYMRVVDDDTIGASGSPKDNVKHLQGAVRLLLRAVTVENPALELLNVFCALYLLPKFTPEALLRLSVSVWDNGFKIWSSELPYEEYRPLVSTYFSDLQQRIGNQEGTRLLQRLKTLVVLNSLPLLKQKGLFS